MNTLQGHLADGSSVQKHSAGGLYPCVVYAQESPTGLVYGVISPYDQDGTLAGSYDDAVVLAEGVLQAIKNARRPILSDDADVDHDLLAQVEAATDKRMDLVTRIDAYEAGQLDDEQTIELFQEMIDSGLVWDLQGSYGRTAATLIRSGLCHSQGGTQDA